MPAHTETRTAAVDVERLFDTVVAEDVLPHVLHRWGPIPAVKGTRELTGPWDTPGSSRTVELANGQTARETVLLWERPRRFGYRVERFDGVLGRLAEHATGSWEFEADGARSRLRWTYTFHPRGRLGRMLLGPFVRIAWSRYMAQCADLCVQRALQAG
jgi:hypothetical protein